MNADGVANEGSAFRDLVRLIWRRKWYIIVPLIAAPAALGLYSSTQERLYQASAEVLLSRDNPVVRLTRRPDPATSPERVAETQASLARVPAITRQVLTEAGVEGRTYREFLDRSAVIAKPNSDLLEFRVRDRTRSIAQRLATEYAREFVAYRRDLYRGILADTAGELAQQIERLRRAGKSKSLLAASLRERLRRVDTLSALQTSDALLVRRAEDAKQVQPAPVRMIMLGLALGLFGGLALALVANSLDSRVRTAAEAGELLGLPLLARIAKPSRRFRRKTSRLVMLSSPNNVEADPYRALRTNVELALRSCPACSLMVTSAADEEGKSTTLANLAVAFARSGYRVILVDLDLQRPMVATLFNLGDRAGAVDLALGEAKFEDVTVPITVADLAPDSLHRTINGDGRRMGWLGVIPAGSRPMDAGELAGAGALTELFESLRSHADLVLVDAPPLLSGGESLAISAHVDAVLAIARLRVVRRPMLEDVGRALASAPAPRLGFVLTGAEREEGYKAHYYVRSGRTKAIRQKQPA